MGIQLESTQSLEWVATTPHQRRSARLTVCEMLADRAEMKEVLLMLGLHEKED